MRRVRQELLLIREGRLLPPPEERGEAGRPDWGDQLPDVPQQDRGGGALRRPLLRHLLWDSPGRSRTLLIYRAILITKYILSERHPRRL